MQDAPHDVVGDDQGLGVAHGGHYVQRAGPLHIHHVLLHLHQRKQQVRVRLLAAHALPLACKGKAGGSWV